LAGLIRGLLLLLLGLHLLGKEVPQFWRAETFIKALNFQSINSDRVSQKGGMGVKLSGSLDGQTQNRLEVEAPNIGRDLYVKSLNSFEVGLYRRL